MSLFGSSQGRISHQCGSMDLTVLLNAAAVLLTESARSSQLCASYNNWRYWQLGIRNKWTFSFYHARSWLSHLTHASYTSALEHSSWRCQGHSTRPAMINGRCLYASRAPQLKFRFESHWNGTKFLIDTNNGAIRRVFMKLRVQTLRNLFPVTCTLTAFCTFSSPVRDLPADEL
jgi:hypothetical protein